MTTALLEADLSSPAPAGISHPSTLLTRRRLRTIVLLGLDLALISGVTAAVQAVAVEQTTSRGEAFALREALVVTALIWAISFLLAGGARLRVPSSSLHTAILRASLITVGALGVATLGHLPSVPAAAWALVGMLAAAGATVHPLLGRAAETLVPVRELRICREGGEVSFRSRLRRTVREFAPRALEDVDLVRAAVLQELDPRRIDRLVVGPDLPQATIDRLSWDLRRTDVDLLVRTGFVDAVPQRVQLHPTKEGPTLLLQPPRPGVLHLALKRTVDVVGAALGLLLLSPFLLVIAHLVRRQDGGPALFRQERIGRDGVPFTIYKFRSMVMNADAQLAELMSRQNAGSTPLFKVSDDPRITPLGRFLRDSSIDELPQLINVLTGSMSLVGPRPQRAEEVALYSEEDAQRLAVRPGITGLWQVSGRSRLSWDQARALDLHYVHNPSFGLDVRILAATVRAVLARDGAQ